ncbi:MAG: type II toxin-antitoxin system mRNA interferase toxin, RelE/StbE family [Gemmatimonadetes bacterium]|nr:MAG: type II toxin-antitoxin system mRNA interferase toxin, RelE/StbE family [Gemmatimonadota bacterium]
MASYKVLIQRSAAKELEGLRPKVRRQVAAKVAGLAVTPRPQGVEKLSGQEKYRIRQGDHRVLYSIDDTAETVTVVQIGHRRDMYR